MGVGQAAQTAQALTVPLDHAQLRALADDADIRAIESALRQQAWTTLHAWTQREALAGPVTEPAMEARAHALARALRHAPPQAGARAWLQRMSQLSPMAMQSLPDAGRALAVPAFPVAAAARATLAHWQAGALADQLRAAVIAGQWPLTAKRADDTQLRAAADRLDDATAAYLLALWPGDRRVPVTLAVRAARHAPTPAHLQTWLTAEATTDVPDAARVQITLATLLSTTDAPTRDAALDMALAQPRLAPVAVAALAEVHDAWSRQRLLGLLDDADLGMDAALALARAGDQTTLQRIAESDAPLQSRRRALIALAATDTVVYLRGWANNPAHPESLREVVQQWLR